MANRTARIPGNLLLWPLVGSALMAGIGYFPTLSITGQSGVEAMIIAQVVVLVVVYVTLISAIYRMIDADKSRRFQIVLQAGAIRFILTLVISIVVAWKCNFRMEVFLIWVVIAYILMINIETLSLIYWNKKLGN
ncbi:MAG: hypothetical protein JSV03_16965 [Planctomycetota bacterium]|nr:MAG: hypothetical protein JSV03_16965 [Planctomycetota bacterium]